jgi:DNA repair exonuclease SbcCD ATPase subunit
MSKDARSQDLELTATEKEKFGELVALLASHGFGEAGPPRETTFAQIEKFGHQAGQMVARAIDARLAEQHASHFADEEPCPACGEKHPPRESRHDLELQTEDGEVRLREPAFRCLPCERDFFPATHSVAD